MNKWINEGAYADGHDIQVYCCPVCATHVLRPSLKEVPNSCPVCNTVLKVEEEELCRLKTPAELKQDKRNEINRVVKQLHDLDAEYFKKRKELEDRACELERQILKGE